MHADAVDTPERLIMGTVHFDTADGIYRDHFPGRPVVPGTLILQGFLTALAGHGPRDETLSVIKLQFKRFLAPGRYAYRIRLTRGEARCAIFEAGAAAAVGTIVLGVE
jgi:3-hydroxyacyl-[acyl-carrier-protein] dehydratase